MNAAKSLSSSAIDYHYTLPLTQIPSHLVTVADYQQVFCQSMPADIVAYVQGNDAIHPSSYQFLPNDSQGCLTNQQALNSQVWQPRVLAPTMPALDCHLYNPTAAVPLDIHLDHPLLLCPTAYHGLYHPDAESATALACQITQTMGIWSCLGNTPFHQLLTSADDTATALHWYWQIHPDNLIDATSNHTSHATLRHERNRAYNWQWLSQWLDNPNPNTKCPCMLVLTVDAPHTGVRAFSRRRGFAVPNHLSTPNLPHGNHDLTLKTLMQNAPTWADVAWLIAKSPIPVVLKGILHPDDAKHAEQIGAAAIMVSNHARRVLADSVAVASVLPAIRHACPRLPIIADGGVMTGSDLAKLLALGANAVGIGRAAIYGLATAGALGVAHTIRLLVDELAVTMAILGASDIGSLAGLVYSDHAHRR